MIYELRLYQPVPGQMPKLLTRQKENAPNVRMGQRQNLGAIELVLVDADSAFEGDLSGLGRSRIFSFNQFLD